MGYRTALVTLAAAPLLFVALILALPTPPAEAQRPQAFAIVGARVFDGENMLPRPQTVLIENGRIAAIGETLRLPEGAATVDGAGRTLLPGLIDAHAHAYGDALAEAVRFGVTTELDMFSAPVALPDLKRGRDAGEVTNRADIFSAGMLATAPRGHGTQFGVPVETLTGPDRAAAWVDARIAEGSDYIKIVYEAPGSPSPYPSIDRATLAALIEAAHARGKMALVHALSQTSARDAVSAGADGLVHMFIQPVDPAFVEEIVRRRVFVTPTLAVLEGLSGRGGTQRLEASLQARLSVSQKATIQGRAAFPPRALADAMANVRTLSAAGVPILAGADAPNPGTAHGASLHAELALLVEAGLTPVQALGAATSVPADRFGLAGRGRIRVGAHADLLLIEGDPAAGVVATQRIVAVWKNGAAVPLAPPSAGAAAPLAPTLVSDFEDGEPRSAWGATWRSTVDRMMGGASDATISVTRDRALRIDGEVRAGFIAPWAGAAIGFADDWTALRDLSGVQVLRFRVRGAPGRYRALAFGAVLAAAPPEQGFEVRETWTEARLPLNGFRGFDPAQARGVAIVAGPQVGRFHLEVDDVRLE